MLNAIGRLVTPLAASAVLVVLPGTAEAGPPLICHPFETGPAALLPWGPGPSWNSPDRSYDLDRLTADTLRLLSPDAPVLARMEVMRRATIYASRDRDAAAALLKAVLDRARATPADGRNPLPWFDAGYLVESYRQADGLAGRNMLADTRVWIDFARAARASDGYALVSKALRLAGSSAEMEFAASLMQQGAAAAEHRRKALAGAPAGSPLARNLAR